MSFFKFNVLTIYLISQWLSWFLLTMFVLVGLTLLFEFADDRNFLNLNSDFDSFRKLIVWLADFLPWLLPIGCFLATLMTLLTLKRNQELLALQSLSISYLPMAKVFASGGLLMSGIATYFSYQDHFTLEDTPDHYGSVVSSFQIKENRFRTWYFESFDESKMEGSNLHLYCYCKNGEDSYRVRAKSASWRKKQGWVFKEGRFLGFPSEEGTPVPGENDELIWEKYTADKLFFAHHGKTAPEINKSFKQMKLSNIQVDPRPHLLLQRKPKELGLRSVNELLKQFPNQNTKILAPFKLRKAQIVWNAPSCMIAVFCAFVLGTGRKQSSAGKIMIFSLLGILSFYLMRTFFDGCGKQNLINEWIAVSLPYLIILLMGIMLYLKSR